MSWYKTTVTDKYERKYIGMLKSVFNVQNPDREWVPYVLQPHQIDWHRDDIALKRYNARSRVVEKSRNTSFTTSSLISNLASVPHYPQQVAPFIRLQYQRAQDLIEDCKKLIKNMNPMVIKGQCYPFNPDDVEMQKAGSIRFPNDVEFRAFPANAQAAEIIRGLRIAGSAGIVDEANFMKDFKAIYIALRDSAAGSKDGKSAFQMNIGTTLRGRTTPFYEWFEDIKKLEGGAVKVYSWPVFDPMKFNVKVPIPQQDVTPIVHWHDCKILEQKRLEDEMRFLEEYMCETVDSETQFYPYQLILQNVNTELRNYSSPPNPTGIYFMGVDVASVNDYFAIVIYEKVIDKFIMRFCYYVRDVQLPDMQDFCEKLIRLYMPVKCRVDNQGIGMQLCQHLQKCFGSRVEGIKDIKIEGTMHKQKVRIKEYLHTNQKTMLSYNKIELLNDEMIIHHFSVWDYTYNADSTEKYGHGDICIASGLALLPVNWKMRKGTSSLMTNLKAKAINVPLQSQEINWGDEE